MDRNTVLVFTRNGLGEAPAELQQRLAGKFLSLIDNEATLPAKILFYTDGVKLACARLARDRSTAGPASPWRRADPVLDLSGVLRLDRSRRSGHRRRHARHYRSHAYWRTR